MKRKSTAKTAKPDAAKVKAVKTAPLSDAPKFIKNVYSSKVKVQIPATERVYTFEPGQSLPVNAQDVNHLLSLKRNPGNCCGSEVEVRHYFEIAE